MNPGHHPHRPFRRAVLRGLAIVLPPLLTLVVFFQAWAVIESYLLIPIERRATTLLAWQTRDIQEALPPAEDRTTTFDNGRVVSFVYNNRLYLPGTNGRWVGKYSDQFIRQHYLRRSTVLLLFVPVFVLILYLLGKFVGAGIGRLLINSFESLIQRLPLVSNVYSAVKQVTDFVFTEREIEFNRVVAVEYPRKGIWSIGFVTGEGMLDIRSAANEPVLNVLIPNSPLPMTGFTITVRKREAVDLNMTIDQAVQYLISCGVVTPASQQLAAGFPAALPAAGLAGSGRPGDHGADAEFHTLEVKKAARETSQ